MNIGWHLFFLQQLLSGKLINTSGTLTLNP
jgi:hypothetical protein